MYSKLPSERTRSYRHYTYGIITVILLSLTAIGIGMNQAVNGQYYDYETGTYHATNTTVFHNVPAVNTTVSDTQYSNALPRESEGPHIQELIKQNQATESYRAELESYITSHNVDISAVQGIFPLLSVAELEAIVKEHIATGSAAAAISDIAHVHFAPSVEACLIS